MTWPSPTLSTPGLLPNETGLGLSRLFVADLDLMCDFYRDLVGLAVLQASDTAITLGHVTPIIALELRDDLPARPAGSAGLFHNAIVFASRSDLALTLLRMSSVPRLYQGSADHAVSEAFYFSDPEGNGLELYYDRPPRLWPRPSEFTVTMGTDYLDPAQFVESSRHDPSAHGRATLGHVHLQVGNIAEGREFYESILGFDVTQTYGDQALFLSAGGYHHHLALNTWGTQGAGPRDPSLGLASFEITVPNSADLVDLHARLAAHSVSSVLQDYRLTVEDPWNTRIEITASRSTPGIGAESR